MKFSDLKSHEMPTSHLRSHNKRKFQPNTNPILTKCYTISANLQDNDQDMADSSSLATNKRGQLVIQPTQQKKTRNEVYTDQAQYVNQDLWLSFQAMELNARDNNVPQREITTPI